MIGQHLWTRFTCGEVLPGVTVGGVAAMDLLRRRILERLGDQDGAVLAQGIGYSPAWVSQFLAGKRGIPLKTAEKIAAFLGVPLWELLFEDNVSDAVRDLTRHTGPADSPDATTAASREAALAALQDAARAIATAAAALHHEPTTARRHAPAHPRVHRPAS